MYVYGHLDAKYYSVYKEKHFVAQFKGNKRGLRPTSARSRTTAASTRPSALLHASHLIRFLLFLLSFFPEVDPHVHETE